MARRVFFSFHYQRDIFRVNVVRNAWVCEGGEEAGYWDASLWEKTRRQGDEALRRLIAFGLRGTSVTAVLIGAETWKRPWVHYEIEQSRKCGNGLLGIRIHNVKSIIPGVRLQSLFGTGGVTDAAGLNPFMLHRMSGARRSLLDLAQPFGSSRNAGDPSLDSVVPVWNWVEDNGYDNIGRWVETAARGAFRTVL